jgi:2-C-methyl-D-erythritol 2,4-cyclodiphosphate synthase
MVRVGQGWDIHRLVAGRPLRLAGIDVPFERGLLGHSDGDVVLHAVADALLGATAAGDLGAHFPDTDARFRGIDSAVLLAEVVRRAAQHGWQIGNVDVTILAERPRLAPHAVAMRARLAELLGIGAEQVGLKAKTTEGLGTIGAGDAIAALAVAVLEQPPPRSPARGRRSAARSHPRRASR